MRIAMWSGPRNISTAMMRSWGNRADTTVIDEPFYAFYLKQKGKAHPGAEEIVDHCQTDAEKVIAMLTGPIPNGRRILYQKQMTHHLLPEIPRDWMREVMNCFLIRDPAEVIVSYVKKQDVDLTIVDLGFEQQLEIYESFGGPVIDATDVLKNPERMLRLLCEAIAVEFDTAMLSWPPGIRETDGVWAKYWYEEVARSTSFQPYRERSHEVPERFRAIHKRCRECYDELHRHRLF
jgi:hypothetical protein